MAYFTAVIARAGDAWKARDVELDEYDNLDDLADALRAVAVNEEPVLAVIEHEDEWFAIVRVDGEDEPRLFVSDLLASARSHYGHMLASAADVDAEEELGGGDEDDDQPIDDEDGVGRAVTRDDAGGIGAGGMGAGGMDAGDVDAEDMDAEDMGMDADVDDVDDVGEEPGDEDGGPDASQSRGSGDIAEPDRPLLAAWAGEIELLEDLGFSAKALRRLAEEHGDDPATVLAEVGEVVGFAELLEALR